MDQIQSSLLARGVELCAKWDKYNAAMIKATEGWERQMSDTNRMDAATRLDELCSLASLLGIASYDDFREQIQKTYEQKEEEKI